jgi:UDP-3-O-[3-hydroxymyristoyl] glucosamine N-acyltransferase
MNSPAPRHTPTTPPQPADNGPGSSRAPAGRAFTSGSVATLLNAELVGPPDLSLRGGAPLELAGPEDLSFIRSEKFAAHWAGSRAGAALVTKGISVPGHDPSRRALLFVPDADLALATLLEHLANRPGPPAGVHPSAVVEAGAVIAPSASVGAQCVIGAGAVVGDKAVLHPRVTLAPGVRVGAGSELHPGVVVYEGCTIGRECILHGNVVIGADGFGYRPDPSGAGLIKVPHVGTVEIHDRVEIGACSCVDRAKMGATIVGAGTKIDNLVQIAHNVRIGRACVIAACSGVAGSVVIGDGVMIGGNVGIADNKTIGSGAKIGGCAAVATDVPAGEYWVGVPAAPARETFKQVAALRKLAGTSKRPQPPQREA